MNTHQIEHILSAEKSTKDIFCGVFPSNEIPHKPSREKCPLAFVANIDPGHLPGTHWVAFYFPKQGPLEYFDTYGRLPLPAFETILNEEFLRSRRTLQNPFSSVCGQYCIYFIFKRCNGISMSNILRDFGENVLENDEIVNYYIEHTFDIDLDVYSVKHMLKQVSRPMKYPV